MNHDFWHEAIHQSNEELFGITASQYVVYVIFSSRTEVHTNSLDERYSPLLHLIYESDNTEILIMKTDLRCTIFKSYSITDFISKVDCHFVRYSLSYGHGGNTPRLRTSNCTVICVSVFMQVLRWKQHIILKSCSSGVWCSKQSQNWIKQNKKSFFLICSLLWYALRIQQLLKLKRLQPN